MVLLYIMCMHVMERSVHPDFYIGNAVVCSG